MPSDTSPILSAASRSLSLARSNASEGWSVIEEVADPRAQAVRGGQLDQLLHDAEDERECQENKGETQCRVGLDCVYHLFHLLLLGRAAQRLMTGLRRLSGMFSFSYEYATVYRHIDAARTQLNAQPTISPNPTGEVFPSILVTSEGGTKAFLEIYKGEPVLVLVGYQQYLSLISPLVDRNYGGRPAGEIRRAANDCRDGAVVDW